VGHPIFAFSAKSNIFSNLQAIRVASVPLCPRGVPGVERDTLKIAVIELKCHFIVLSRPSAKKQITRVIQANKQQVVSRVPALQQCIIMLHVMQSFFLGESAVELSD
jgi:hypothetical protein